MLRRMELSVDYFVRTAQGAESGPYTADELRDLARAKRLKPTDFVRRGEFGAWVLASRTRGFEFSDSKKPVPPPMGEERAEPTGHESTAASSSESGDSAASSPNAATAPDSDATSSASDPTASNDRVGRMPHEATTDMGFIVSLARIGYPVRALPDESVCYVIEQTFWDAFRVSILAAILGRRGMLVVTSRRLIIVGVSVRSRDLDAMYLDKLDRVSFARRTRMLPFVLGLWFTLVGVASLALTIMLLFSDFGSTVAPSAPVAAAYAIAWTSIGVLLIRLSRVRVIEFGVASGTVRFSKHSSDFDAIHRIAEARAMAVAGVAQSQ